MQKHPLSNYRDRLEAAALARVKAEVTFARAASRLEEARAAERQEIAACEALLATEARERQAAGQTD